MAESLTSQLTSLILDSFNKSIIPEKRFADSKQSIEILSQLINALHYSRNCCARCCLRYTNLHDARLFQQSEGTIRELVHQFAGKSENKECQCYSKAKCVVCLDVLSTIDSPKFKEGLLFQFEKNGFEIKNFSDFTCAVTVPSSVCIRQHSLWFFIQNLYPSIQAIPRYVELKDVIKWSLVKLLQGNSRIDFNPASNLCIYLTFSHKETENESDFLKKLEKKSKKRKQSDNWQDSTPMSLNSVVKVLHYVTKDQFIKNGTCPPVANFVEECTCDIVIEHFPVFIAGRYIKKSRDMSQTKWIIDGVRKATHSVEETISSFLSPVFKSETVRFHGAGREDADVRMLGMGRPFIIEFVNPHRIRINTTLSALQDQFNAQCSVLQLRDLQLITKPQCVKLKEGEEEKTKSYRCVVWIEKEITSKEINIINNVKDLEIIQKTPIRVMHRRVLMSRKKIIHKMTCEEVNDHMIILDLTTQAGTYIKEFIHGDLGRTLPNFSTIIGSNADILQLDVLAINSEFPPITSK